MERWPTIRQAARSLNVSQKIIAEEQDDSNYMLTGFNYPDRDVYGDLFIESQMKQVDIDWCGYWLSMSSKCYCGEHSRKFT